MKQLRTKFMSMLAIAGVIGFASCGPEETEEPKAGPVITITSTPAATDNSIDLEVGDEITIDVDVVAEGGFNVLRVSGGYEAEYPRTTAGETTFSQTLPVFEITSNLAGTTITLNFEAVDDLDQTATATFTINVAEAPIETFEAVLLGAQGNNEPGFLDALTGTRRGYASARDNSATVDFAYYFGNTNKASLAAIDDAGLDAVYSTIISNGNPLTIDNFATKNATRFSTTTVTAAEFDAIENNGQLQEEAIFETAGTSSVTNVAVGNVFAFKTVETRGGLFGLVKIVAINDTNGTGTITVEVKVPSQE